MRGGWLGQEPADPATLRAFRRSHLGRLAYQFCRPPGGHATRGRGKKKARELGVPRAQVPLRPKAPETSPGAQAFPSDGLPKGDR